MERLYFKYGKGIHLKNESNLEFLFIIINYYKSFKKNDEINNKKNIYS